MFQVIRALIPIRIKNVQNPDGGGTVIYPDLAAYDATNNNHFPSGSSNAESLIAPEKLTLVDELKNTKLPTAVTIKENIIVLNVNSNRKSVSHGFLAGIFGTLDRFGVVVDLISTSEVHISMAIEGKPASRFLDRLVTDLKETGTVCFIYITFMVVT